MKCLIVLPALLLVAQAIEPRKLDWWETTVFYQIYPRSFKDSDGDGVGDLNGITSKLDYLKELGVGATWLSPIFESPMYDFGYDISDFYAIQPEYGTMDDFVRLLQKAKELDIKIVLDFVPNHSSNESVWFKEALKGNPKYFNYFLWEDGIVENGVMRPPTNWNSVFRGSAWTYREEVGKYYFHQFVEGQPDLNYRNPDVVKELTNVFKFWLDKGVAGFRVSAISHLFEVDKAKFGGKYPDEPRSGNLNVDEYSYDYYDHIYTKNQEETYEMVYKWRKVLDEYKAKDGFTRVMMTEVYASPQITMRYFGDGEVQGAQMPFNFALIEDLNEHSSAFELKYATDKFLTFKPIDKLANWVAANHDYRRAASKFGPQLLDGINMAVLLLPGIAVTYMGDEIGMKDGFVSWEDTVDPNGCNTNDPINYNRFSRDPARTPFQWNSDVNAGFSSAQRTWLPVAEGYETLNVAIQTPVENSHLNLYKSLVRLREKNPFRHGRFESVAFNEGVFAFKRWMKGEAYVVVMNLRDVSYSIDLSYFEHVDGFLKVIFINQSSSKTSGDYYSARSVPVGPYEAFIVEV